LNLGIVLDLIDRSGVFVALFQVQVTVFLIPFQNAVSLQVLVNPVADRMHRHCQFLMVEGIGTMKSTFTPGRGDIDRMERSTGFIRFNRGHAYDQSRHPCISGKIDSAMLKLRNARLLVCVGILHGRLSYY
jgi:hypothetical protein